jgi:hypothetical protein
MNAFSSPSHCLATDVRCDSGIQALRWHVTISHKMEVVTVVTMKIAVFWDVTPCNSIDGYQCSVGTCCLHLQGHFSTLNTEAAGSSKMLLLIYKSKGNHIPQDSNLQHTWYYVISHEVISRLMRKQVCKLRIAGPSTSTIMYLWFLIKCFESS